MSLNLVGFEVSFVETAIDPAEESFAFFLAVLIKAFEHSPFFPLLHSGSIRLILLPLAIKASSILALHLASAMSPARLEFSLVNVSWRQDQPAIALLHPFSPLPFIHPSILPHLHSSPTPYLVPPFSHIKTPSFQKSRVFETQLSNVVRTHFHLLLSQRVLLTQREVESLHLLILPQLLLVKLIQ